MDDQLTETRTTADLYGTSSDARIAALAALYQGEKTDTSYVFNTAMVMMGVAVTYVVGAVPWVRSLSEAPVGWLLILLLPVPLLLVVAFHSLMTLNAMSHGISVRIIENELFRAAGFAPNKRDLVGSAAGDKIMDITQAKLAHKVTSVVVYAGVALLVFGFTVYAVYSSYEVINRTRIWIHALFIWRAAIVIYACFILMVVLSWKSGLASVGQGRRDSMTPQDTVTNE